MAASSYAGSIVSTSTGNNDHHSDRGDPRFGGGGGDGYGFRDESSPVLEAAFGVVDAAVFATVLGVTVSCDCDINLF